MAKPDFENLPTYIQDIVRAFDAAASQEPRSGLSMQLPDAIAGLSLTGNSGPTGIAQAGASKQRSIDDGGIV
jgi:hypothetical protein